MRVVCIPTVGDKLFTMATWKVKIYFERRNYVAIGWFTGDLEFTEKQSRASYFDDFEGGEDAVRAKWDGGGDANRKHIVAQIDAGATLTVDRIYLRKGAGEFDSVTLILNRPATAGKKKGPMVRFWVRLQDLNDAHLVLLPPPPPAEKPAKAKSTREDTQWG